MRSLLWLCLLPGVALAGGFTWTVPEPIHEIEMPGKIETNQIPVTIRAAVSHRSADALLDYYFQEFAHAGLYVAPANKQTKSTIYPELTALDVDTRTSYTVILQPNKDGSTTVIMGSADLSNFPNQSTPQDFAPLPPEAYKVSRINTEGQQLIFFATTQSEKQVSDYFGKELPVSGYKLDKDGRYTRPDGWVSVQTRVEKNVTWVHLEHGGGAAK